MKTLVIYDSVYGNTEKIAQAIAEELLAQGEVTIRRVGEVSLEQLSRIDLLVVGSPTQPFEGNESGSLRHPSNMGRD
jgi:flavodoxin